MIRPTSHRGNSRPPTSRGPARFAARRAIVALAFAFAAAVALSSTPALAAQSGAAQTSAWNTYTYTADGFKVSFPSPPAVGRQSVPTGAGSSETHSYTVQSGPVSLVVGAAPCPACAARPDPDAILQTAKAGAVANTKSTLISERKITLDGNPGIAFEAETDAIHLSVRIYVAGGMLYQIVVGFPLPNPYPDANRFFNSFQILPREKENAAKQDGQPDPAAK